MDFKKIDSKYFIRIDKGEEIVEVLTGFCRQNNITLGTITGIGATDDVTIGLFDVEKKKYYSQTMKGDYEIVPLIGTVTTKDGETYLHLHINIADSSQKSFGGHLNKAIVSATFECVIDTVEGIVERKFDEETGLNLMYFK